MGFNQFAFVSGYNDYFGMDEYPDKLNYGNYAALNVFFYSIDIVFKGKSDVIAQHTDIIFTIMEYIGYKKIGERVVV